MAQTINKTVGIPTSVDIQLSGFIIFFRQKLETNWSFQIHMLMSIYT